MIPWAKENISVLITLALLIFGGYGSYIRLGDQLSDVRNKVVAIEKEGTEKQRTLEKKVLFLEEQNNSLAKQMKEQSDLLNKIDRRVGYLLCKSDKRFCVE